MYCCSALCSRAPFVSINRFFCYHSSSVTFGNVTKLNKWLIHHIFITQIKCETCMCQRPVFTNGPLAVFKETNSAFSWRIITSINIGNEINGQLTSTNGCSSVLIGQENYWKLSSTHEGNTSIEMCTVVVTKPQSVSTNFTLSIKFPKLDLEALQQHHYSLPAAGKRFGFFSTSNSIHCPLPVSSQ